METMDHCAGCGCSWKREHQIHLATYNLTQVYIYIVDWRFVHRNKFAHNCIEFWSWINVAGSGVTLASYPVPRPAFRRCFTVLSSDEKLGVGLGTRLALHTWFVPQTGNESRINTTSLQQSVCKTRLQHEIIMMQRSRLVRRRCSLPFVCGDDNIRGRHPNKVSL